MTGLVLMAVLVAGSLAAILWPILGRPPAALGRGLEDDAPIRRWEAERARLIDAMRDNDLALAEGRLDAATREANAARLADEAERVLARLRAARTQFDTTPEPEGASGRAARPLTAAALALTILAGLGAAQLARWQDIDLTGSPHADGSVPLDTSDPSRTAALPPVMDGNGVPDIEAMVARLERRVAQGDASADEIKMLLRSYDTLGRLEEAGGVLDAALDRFPDDPDFQLGWLRAAITLSRTGDAGRGLQIADRLIADNPGLLEARWYRSLFLVALEQKDRARTELMDLAPRLPVDSPAHVAVTKLIAELNHPPG